MRFSKKMYFGAGSLLVTLGTLVTLGITSSTSQAVSSYRDCAEDTVIKCGAITEAELLQKYDANVGDVQHVYPHYGISRSDLAGQTSQIKHGTVYQDGRVVVDGKTVATNAYSVSRIRFSSQSRAVVINGVTFYEGPDMSIFVRAVDAYVYMRNGVFYRAILSACGNPLMATPVQPPVQPVYTCDDLKSEKIDRTKFKFTPASTIKNGAEFVSYTYDFGDGKTLTDSGSTAIHTYAKAGTYTTTVKVTVKVDGQNKSVTSTSCKVTIKVEDVPVTPLYSCDGLKAEKIDRTKFKFIPSSTLEGGAKFASYTYDFGDGKSLTDSGSTAIHTYAKAGTFTTTVKVNVLVNGKTVVATGANCKVTIKVEELPTTPTSSCDSLKADKIDRTNFKFTTAASASNGSEIVNYQYDFGDGAKQTLNAATVNHTYAKPGTYTVTVYVYVKTNGETKIITGTNCHTTVTVDKVPVTPKYACESLTATKINRTTFDFTSKASADGGAEIVSYTYNFGDAHTQTINNATVTHTYDKPGTYTITVSVKVKVGTKTEVATGANCETTVKVENVPVTPEYTCDDLTVKGVSGKIRTYDYTLTYTAEGGATLKKVVYNFGDNTSATYAAAVATPVQHTYTADGTYTTSATLYFDVKNGETVVEKTIDCEVSVTISPEMCTKPGKEMFPKNSPECAEKPEMCDMPGKETLPKGSPECNVKHEMCDKPGKETLEKNSSNCVETPTELPKTGIENMLSGSVGIGSVTTAGYYWLSSRKNLLRATRNR